MTTAETQAQDAPDDADEDFDAEGPRWDRLSWPKVIVLVAAFCFLAGSAGYLLGRGRPPDAGSVDVGFYQDMITHHEQARTMAILEYANGADETVRTFAREVLIQQSYEIGLMDARLDEWGYGSDDRSDVAMAWMDSPVPVEQMPGLATASQLDQLRAARGRDSDVLFLQLMANHHRGGLHMASYAARYAGDAKVKHLAALMSYNQSTEINEYATTAERLGLPVTIERQQTPPYPNDTGG